LYSHAVVCNCEDKSSSVPSFPFLSSKLFVPSKSAFRITKLGSLQTSNLPSYQPPPNHCIHHRWTETNHNCNYVAFLIQLINPTILLQGGIGVTRNVLTGIDIGLGFLQNLGRAFVSPAIGFLFPSNWGQHTAEAVLL
jgi:hypothetical protein